MSGLTTFCQIKGKSSSPARLLQSTQFTASRFGRSGADLPDYFQNRKPENSACQKLGQLHITALFWVSLCDGSALEPLTLEAVGYGLPSSGMNCLVTDKLPRSCGFRVCAVGLMVLLKPPAQGLGSHNASNLLGAQVISQRLQALCNKART